MPVCRSLQLFQQLIWAELQPGVWKVRSRTGNSETYYGARLGVKTGYQLDQGYLVLGECVVEELLAVLTGLGIAASGKNNSSHQFVIMPRSGLVQTGLQRWCLELPVRDPLQLVAAVGDPVAVAGMAIAASHVVSCLLVVLKCWLFMPNSSHQQSI